MTHIPTFPHQLAARFLPAPPAPALSRMTTVRRRTGASIPSAAGSPRSLSQRGCLARANFPLRQEVPPSQPQGAL